MNKFVFDLQRFDSITLAGDTLSTVITIAGTPKTIKAGTDNDVRISVLSDESAAIITLSSAGDEFYVNDIPYVLKTSGGNGIVVTLGGGSAATVGSIDNGDTFTINNEKFSKTSYGFFSGTATPSAYDKMIIGSSANTLALSGSSILADDLEANWYKLVQVDNDVLVLDGSEDFDSSGYKGIIAIDSDGTTPKFYAQLSQRELPDRGYRISSVTSASTLSRISVTSDVLSGGVVFASDFTASGTNAPVIMANGATFHIDSSSGYILLSGGRDSEGNNTEITLNENVKKVSLGSGSIRAVGCQSENVPSFFLFMLCRFCGIVFLLWK
mgnify:CR=1 FL=1